MNRDQPQHHPLHVVIPVKPFAEGKTRLAGALTAAQRIALNRQLFDRTLARVSDFPGPAHATVVSRSSEVLQRASDAGFGTLLELASDGLNAALRCGTLHARALGAGAIVVMPVDLPGGDGEDLRRLVETAPRGPFCLLVPDHHGQGTNLLFQSPVVLEDYAFGPGSLARHWQLARRCGLAPRVMGDSVFAFDIDDPADYLRWRLRESATSTTPNTPHASPLPLAWTALQMS